jgi:hypothetical protein
MTIEQTWALQGRKEITWPRIKHGWGKELEQEGTEETERDANYAN